MLAMPLIAADAPLQDIDGHYYAAEFRHAADATVIFRALYAMMPMPLMLRAPR